MSAIVSRMPLVSLLLLSSSMSSILRLSLIVSYTAFMGTALALLLGLVRFAIVMSQLVRKIRSVFCVTVLVMGRDIVAKTLRSLAGMRSSVAPIVPAHVMTFLRKHLDVFGAVMTVAVIVLVA